ncbi:MAG: hypothetical protein NUV70_01835 [Caldiserica bacterium]|jgi:hypothetical protein|nr:hypothetical protein [Caldisericota bacterium]
MSADRLITWLLEGSPWVQYRTRLDLLHQKESDPEVLKARQEMIKHRQVQGLLAELAQWPGSILSSHKSAGHPLHKLIFVADLGLKATDPEIKQIIERICEHQAPEGSFQVLMNIPPRYGGTGKDQWAWALCDAPLILYALVKFGLGEDERIQKASAHLVSLIKENGWPCAVSEELGKFRGPGRKEDPCPYANLIMLKALSQIPGLNDSSASYTGVETLLALWEGREKRHPYMFFMGTDFCKLKAPFVWYDILHVADVLTQFPWLRADARLKAMIGIIKRKADEEGRFIPESIWEAWKEWDFGQKRVPSRWLTLAAQRVLKRMQVQSE